MKLLYMPRRSLKKKHENVFAKKERKDRGNGTSVVVVCDIKIKIFISKLINYFLHCDVFLLLVFFFVMRKQPIKVLIIFSLISQPSGKLFLPFSFLFSTLIQSTCFVLRVDVDFSSSSIFFYFSFL